MKYEFTKELPEFSFDFDHPDHRIIRQFHKEQMEELFHKPTLLPRPENTPSRTYRHSKRVAQDIHDFARFIGLNEERANHLKFATELHDIGKLDIPLKILDKPGKLTDAELTEMKRHTIYGAQRIKSCQADHPILDLAYNIAMFHHERMDGKGYHNTPPEEIPIYVRLVQVCDIFDAISARRPYRTDREQMSAYDVMSAMIIDDGFLYHEVDQLVTRAFITMKCYLLDTGLSHKEREDLLSRVGQIPELWSGEIDVA